MANMNGLIAIEIVNNDEKLFRAFCNKYRTSILFMLENEVFDIKRGSATLNFDKDSNLVSIDKHTFTYAKGSVV